MEESIYQVALKKLDGIGSSRAKALVAHCGGIKQVFEATKSELLGIPGIGTQAIRKLNRDKALREAEEELNMIEGTGIDLYFYLDEAYPSRLKHCPDGPVLLYGKGNLQLNPGRVVSIVGTRNCTEYGSRLTERLIEGLKAYDVLVVSGLAYGVDTLAHRFAVQYELPTVGVLGHSLDRIYPAQNAQLAKQMLSNGGLLSEFDLGTQPDRENFPQRNRIVAGMADVTVVVETMVKGGSMITAHLAAGYSRDVAAFPGALDAPYSSGCNHLIKTNVAALIEGMDDLAYLMGWEKEEKTMAPQRQMFVDLEPLERQVYDLLLHERKASLDDLSLSCEIPVSKASSTLLELEFKGVIRSLPGKMFEVV